ncbi:MAG: hypothetical protein AAF196_05115 [Planctomycetota bacterium]
MNAQDRDDLQRWLDGSLEGAALTDFERRCETDPELRDEIRLHQSIDQSLRRSFSVPELNLERAGPPRRVAPWIPFVLGALGAAAMMLVWLQPWNTPEEPSPEPEVAQMLRSAVGRSWLLCCEQPEELPTAIDWSATSNLPGPPIAPTGCSMPDQLPLYIQPLAPDLPSPLVWRAQPGVQFQRGLEERPEEGLRVIELLVEPSTKTFLFVVSSTNDPRPTLPEASEWRLFRDVRGPLVLYELTPLDRPRGLECVGDVN